MVVSGDWRKLVVPDSVEELCASCFSERGTLHPVTFVESPSSNRFDIDAFCGFGQTDLRPRQC